MPSSPGKGGGHHRGSHRGPARGPQLLKAGGLLLAVALLLAAVGFGIVWTTDSQTSEPGKFKADRVKDLCDAVNAEGIQKFAPKEDDRQSDSDKKQNPAKFTCELRFTSGEESTSYQAITLSVDARVAATVGDAEKAFEGVVDYEKSRGFAVDKSSEGDQAAVVPKANTDPQECRAHIRSSNAVLSAELTVSGSQLSCAKEGVELLLETGTSTLDVMRSE
ncbi:hypothetical protein [Stackebrandtia nassauensis]|uniref:Uncharacterized protein n=1 Tax=Stackebrandtia nassauensis (strain DSM 44728 / CIP 108903 / NRRL B-16338 / NBRC 102104 / LLR-40K-21) TaxID=446470 RepID=D3PVZ4_STANL|nr:hypothetical protein [Stackebrandtia nassauensis]ADD45115.1 hypothetical protein Snas_5484 [Stackebrandtia nassauensis DSM 44728]